MQSASAALEKYQDWVRHNAGLASNVELLVRAITFLNMDPNSLFAVEAAYSCANIIGIIHQAAHEAGGGGVVADGMPAVAAPSSKTADDKVAAFAKRQRTLQLLLRILRESQCVGELLLRKLLLLPHLGSNTSAVAAIAGSTAAAAAGAAKAKYLVAVQLYIVAIEGAKLWIKMDMFRDVWGSVGWQLVQFFGRRDSSHAAGSLAAASSSTSSAVGKSGNGGGGSGIAVVGSAFKTLLTGFLEKLGLVPAGTAAARGGGLQFTNTVTLPHVVSSGAGSSNIVLSQADRVCMWIDLLDMLKPLVMSLALVQTWHKRASLHRAWMIWLAGLAYEIVAALLQRALHRHRSAFLRQDGSLVQNLSEAASGRGRAFAVGVQLLRYPFFNTIIEPEMRRRLLTERSWLGRIPLLGGYAQGWLAYMIEVQKRCVLFASGA